VYARYAALAPEEMQIVAVADPNEARRQLLSDHHGIPAEHRFSSHEQLATRPGLADAVINTTLDIAHFDTTLPLLRAGYHVLLEKPIAPSEQQVRELMNVARENDRVVMVCHILRYEPFYETIKSRIESNAIGKLVSIHTTENVSYDHVVTTYIRHPRNLQPTIFPMLLTKCCHDLDVLAWLKGNTPLARVSSVIKPTQFVPENAPPGSTERCLGGCAVESVCQYSARTLYVEDDKWDAYPWAVNEYSAARPAAKKLEILATTSPYGRCAWRCPNPVVDHQHVTMEFIDGVTATHDLYTATPRGTRSLRIVGTAGELEGDFTAGHIVIRRPMRGRSGRYAEEHTHVPPYDPKATLPRQCERSLMADFIGTLRGDPVAPRRTLIQDSLIGHQIAFAADVSAHEHRVVNLADFSRI
jgi:predicted dehydrogenase